MIHPEVIVSIINTAGTLLGLVLSAGAAAFAARSNHNAKKGRESSGRAAKSAAATHEGANNTHSTHLRDDLDGLGDKVDQLTEAMNAGLEALWLAIKGDPSPGAVKLPEGHQ